jgi:ATP-dependent RNA helicase RhlE
MGGARFAGRPIRATRHRSANIDPAKFVRKAAGTTIQAAFVAKHQFTDFALSDRLQKNLALRGYQTPTPIQDEAIIPIGQGNDLIGLANTGTGKTAAFLLPIMNRLQDNPSSEAVLVMVPTRELAGQIADEFRAFSHGLAISCTVIVGGAPIKRQISNLQRRPHVIIGTPGRLKDLVTQRKLDLSRIQTLVLDEADQMLDMGFIKDIRFIISHLPAKRQSLCFSATLSPEIEQLVRDMLHNPVTVSVRTGTTSENVDQDVLFADTPIQKVQMLVDMLAKPEFGKVLVFGKTKHGVQRLADGLHQQGLKVEAIHGNKSQGQRQRALQQFKDDRVQVLVATDVAARGLDIPDVTHVINFDQPTTYADYIHRIGRTGRAGKTGKALTFVPSNSRV